MFKLKLLATLVLVFATTQQSVAAPQIDSCTAAFPSREQLASTALFDASKYEAFRSYFEKSGVALGDPFRTSNEELMAAIDTLNAKSSRALEVENQTSLAKTFETTDGETYEEIGSWMDDWRSHARMTSRDVDRAVARLDRILSEKTLSRKMKLWISKWTRKAVHLRLSQVPDDLLLAQVQKKLLTRGLIKGLEGIGALQTEGPRASLESWYSRNQDVLRFVTSTVFNAASVSSGSYALFLPQSGKSARVLRSPEILDQILRGELKLDDIKKKTNKKFDHAYNVFASLVSTIGTISLLASVPGEYKQMAEKQAVEQKNNLFSQIEQQAKPVDPQAQAEIYFEGFVQSLRAKGENPDVNSPEMITIHEAFRSGFGSLK